MNYWDKEKFFEMFLEKVLREIWFWWEFLLIFLVNFFWIKINIKNFKLLVSWTKIICIKFLQTSEILSFRLYLSSSLKSFYSATFCHYFVHFCPPQWLYSVYAVKSMPFSTNRQLSSSTLLKSPFTEI